MRKLLVFLMLIMCFGLFADFVEVGGGTAGTSYVPVYGYFDYNWSKVIYTAEELTNQAFTITGLQYQYYSSPNGYEMLNQSVYIGYTDLETFSSTAYVNPLTAGATKVYDGNITFTGNQGDWFTLDFNVNDFEYNGTGNIIIYWENRDGSYAGGYPRWYYKFAQNYVCYKYKDGSFPDNVAGSLAGYKANTRFLTDDTLSLPESVDIPAGNTDIYETTGSLIEIAFTENDHPDINISILLNEVAPSVVGDLPETISSLLPVYWTINTVTGQGHNYTITFDLATIEGYNGDIEYKILKRSDSTQAWFDVDSVPGVELSYNGSKVTVTGLNSFSEFAPGIPSETLPVELSSFSAIATSDNFAQISWTTASESNLLGYNIYRSETENQDDAFRVTATMITASNQAMGDSYSFTDDEVEMNTTYNYWLQSNDFDGTSQMFGPVTVKISDQEDHDNDNTVLGSQLYGNYPNPFNPETTIFYSISQPQHVRLEVYNMRGQLVKTLLNEQVDNANTRLSIVWKGNDNSNNKVSSGIYLYKLVTDDYCKSNKMILMK